MAHHHNHHPLSQFLVDDHRYLQKIVHTLGGIFIWEYFTTIWFEWSFVTRKRSYRWSIWLYAGIRFVTLLNVLANLLQSDLNKSINCQSWLYFEYVSIAEVIIDQTERLSVFQITVYTAFTLGTLIMILKICAVWHGNKWVIGTCISAWLANIGFFIRCIVTTSAHWESSLGACVLHRGWSIRDSILATLCTEMFLLLVTLAGLTRERDHYLGRLLFNQGLIWLCVAICAQVPLIVLFSIDRRDMADLVFHSSSLLSMAITVTRLYRGLSMVNDPPSAQRSWNISAIGPGRPIVFAPYYSSNQSRIQSQTIERSITISLPALEQGGANEVIPRPLPKSAPSTVTVFRGHEAA